MLKVQHRGTTLKLKWLTDREYEKAERLASASGTPLSTCPTCLAPGREIPAEVADEPEAYLQRIYRYRGEEYFCECEAQKALRARYLLAGIGDQYMRLDWADYDG